MLTTNQLRQIIGRPGQTSRVIDLGLRLWSATIKKAYGLTSPRGVPFFKSVPGIQPLPEIDTADHDRARELKNRRDDRALNSRGGTDSRPEQKADSNANPDHKPVSLNKHKIRFPSGRTYEYTVSESGALTKKEVNDFIPTFNEMPAHDFKHFDAIHKQASADAKTDKPTVQNKAYIAKPGKGYAGITLTTFTDGTMTIRPEASTPADISQTVTPEQKRRLLQLAIKHLKSGSGQQAPDAESIAPSKKGESKSMEKSQAKMPVMLLRRTLKTAVKTAERSPRTPIFKSKPSVSEPRDMALPVVEKIEKAQPEPEKFDLRPFDVATMPAMERVGYLSRRFDYLQAEALKKSQQQPTEPVKTYADMRKTAMTYADYSKLSGKQRVALKIGLDVNTPGIENMTYDAMVSLFKDKQLAEVNERRHAQHLPPILPERQGPIRVATKWDF